MRSNRKDLDAKGLKAKLHQAFPEVESYSSDDQDDAGIPFWSICQCFPNLAAKFNIMVRKRRKCLACGYSEDVTEAQLHPEFLNLGNKEDLQTKIDKWCNSRSEISKRCDCKMIIN